MIRLILLLLIFFSFSMAGQALNDAMQGNAWAIPFWIAFIFIGAYFLTKYDQVVIMKHHIDHHASRSK